MSDYAFVHEGRAFTPSGAPGGEVADVATRNSAIEQSELAYWAARPDRIMAYYDESRAVVTTWPGGVLGAITRSHVYRHNFGSRFISILVRGTNGAEYYGHASYDYGTCITLRICRRPR